MANRFLNNITINDAYTLPSEDGTNGQVITTDGSGVLSFADAAASDAIVLTVKNVSGGSLSKGTVVYVSPSANPPSGNVIEVSAADNSSASTMPALAVLNATLADDAEGEAIAFGQLSGIDTSAFTAGDAIYVNTSGGFTSTKPTGTALIQKIGMVVKSHASNGSIKIFGAFRSNDVPNILQDYIWLGNSSGVATPTEHLLNNVKDVTTSSPTDGQVLTWDNTNSYWKNADATGGGGSASELSIERDVFTATADQTAFTITSSITSGSNTQVYIDGVYQAKDNYTTSGSTITFSTGVPLGAEVEVVHFISVLSKVYTDTFTGNGSTVAYTASKDVTDENVTQVYIDGVYQSKDNYTTSGTTITFSTAPPDGSAIEVVHFTAAEYSTLNSNQFTGTGSQTDFTLTQAVDVDKSFVFIQGVYQEKSTYSISGTTLTFTTAPLSGYTIEVITVGSVSVFNDTLFLDNFTGNGTLTDYTLSTTPASENAIDVYLNGIYQNKDTFTLSGNTLTFSTAPTSGTAIEVKSTGGLNNVVTSSGGGISWQTTPKTASFTATAGEGYFVNTTSAAITVTLPSSPTAGDEVSIVDYAGTADTNNITITSSDNINGSSDNVRINYERGAVSMVYADATQGWIVYNAANETATALNDAPTIVTVDYLVVAGGGGGGGSYYGGGGGAGGLRTSYGSTSGGGSSSESALSLESGVNYTIFVGNGGTGVQSNTGNNGGDSYIQLNSSDLKRSLGGGGGDGGGTGSTTSSYGSNGGSGGGYSLYNNGTYGGGDGTSGQGYGGSDQAVSGYSSSGGGAGEAGHTADADAGDGIYVNILNATNATAAGVGEVSGANVYYAGGGGGSTSANSNAAAQGGLGGGGNGGRYISYQNNVAPTPGAANTGGGGAGGVHVGTDTGSSGGSGVVILRYPSDYTVTVGSGIIEASGSPFTEGSDKVSVFTGGTGNISFS